VQPEDRAARACSVSRCQGSGYWHWQPDSECVGKPPCGIRLGVKLKFLPSFSTEPRSPRAQSACQRTITIRVSSLSRDHPSPPDDPDLSLLCRLCHSLADALSDVTLCCRIFPGHRGPAERPQRAPRRVTVLGGPPGGPKPRGPGPGAEVAAATFKFPTAVISKLLSRS
jgi:hypothetical protein